MTGSFSSSSSLIPLNARTVGVDDISMLQLIGLLLGLLVLFAASMLVLIGFALDPADFIQLDTSNGFVVHEILCPLNDTPNEFCNQHAVSSFQPINNFVANSLQPRSKFCALIDLLVPVVHAKFNKIFSACFAGSGTMVPNRSNGFRR